MIRTDVDHPERRDDVRDKRPDDSHRRGALALSE